MDRMCDIRIFPSHAPDTAALVDADTEHGALAALDAVEI
jgi:hypothetical protein